MQLGVYSDKCVTELKEIMMNVRRVKYEKQRVIPVSSSQGSADLHRDPTTTK